MTYLLLLFWVFGFAFLWRIPFLRRGGHPGKCGPQETSIVIPARNEEASLGLLLDSLRQQPLKPLEIIVVDDHSEDGTARIAANAGCAVLRSKDLPVGWAGKPWACWQGAARAKGKVYLFLDADTRLEPGGLSRILAAYEEKGGLVSVQPYHHMEKGYEKLAAFFNLIAMGGMRAFTPLGERLKPLGAFGPCMVCSKEDYFGVGGHAIVRGDVLESLALGQGFLRTNRRVSCYGGKGTISFRMYPRGLRSLIEGFDKGFGTGANVMSLGSLLMMVCWVFGGFSVTRHLVQSVVLGNTADLICFAVLDGLYVVQIHWMLARIGNFGLATALLFQIPLIFFALVFASSILRIFFLRRVRWKGRSVRT